MFSYEQWHRRQQAAVERWQRETAHDHRAEIIREAMLKSNQHVLMVGEFAQNFYNRKNFQAKKNLPAHVHLEWWKNGWSGDTVDDFRAFIEAEAQRASLPAFQMEWEGLHENCVRGPMVGPGWEVAKISWIEVTTVCRWERRDGTPRRKEEGFLFIVTDAGVDGWKLRESRTQTLVLWRDLAQQVMNEVRAEQEDIPQTLAAPTSMGKLFKDDQNVAGGSISTNETGGEQAEDMPTPREEWDDW